MLESESTSATITRWWVLTLGVGAVVIAVVAALLLRIIRAANSIDRYAADIWDAGQAIARNTAAIWQLGQTNSVAGQILATAQSIDGHAAAIDQALNGAGPTETAPIASGSASPTTVAQEQ